MTRARKYRPGQKIKTVAALLREIDAKRYVYWGARPCHPIFVGNVGYWNLKSLTEIYGRFRYAKENA